MLGYTDARPLDKIGPARALSDESVGECALVAVNGLDGAVDEERQEQEHQRREDSDNGRTPVAPCHQSCKGVWHGTRVNKGVLVALNTFQDLPPHPQSPPTILPVKRQELLDEPKAQHCIQASASLSHPSCSTTAPGAY